MIESPPADGLLWAAEMKRYWPRIFRYLERSTVTYRFGSLAAEEIRAFGRTLAGGLSALGAALYGIGIPKDSIMWYETALKSRSWHHRRGDQGQANPRDDRRDVGRRPSRDPSTVTSVGGDP
jgi:hypothetical protein